MIGIPLEYSGGLKENPVYPNKLPNEKTRIKNRKKRKRKNKSKKR